MRGCLGDSMTRGQGFLFYESRKSVKAKPMSFKHRKAGALHVFLQLQQAPRRTGRNTRVVSNNRKLEQMDEMSDSTMIEGQGFGTIR